MSGLRPAARWFSIQCDESVDNRSTAQLMVFIWMVFDDCAKVTGFEHVITPIVKIINGIRSKAKQRRIFKVL